MLWLTSAKLMSAVVVGALTMAAVRRATTWPDFVREMPPGSVYAAMWDGLWLFIILIAGQVLEAATGVRHFFYAFSAGVLIVAATSIWRSWRRASAVRPRVLLLLDQGMSPSEVAEELEIEANLVVFLAEQYERRGR